MFDCSWQILAHLVVKLEVNFLFVRTLDGHQQISLDEFCGGVKFLQIIFCGRLLHRKHIDNLMEGWTDLILNLQCCGGVLNLGA